ncbi:MAG: septation protein SpoVG family protein, partial [Ruminococcus sp.]|nr:septation protein SpoVG family protein [Ruminococcus sp.]
MLDFQKSFEEISTSANQLLSSYSEKPIEFTNEVQIITAMSKLRDKILSQDDGTQGLGDFLREEANKCTEIENQAKELIAAKTQAVKADTVTADISAPQKTEPTGTISRIVITPLEKEKFGTVALASVTIDDALTINSVLIRKSQDGSGYWVQMPQKRTQDGTYINVAHSLTANARINLNNQILDMYQSGNFKFIDDATANKIYDPKIKALNCEKFNNPESKVKARMDI